MPGPDTAQAVGQWVIENAETLRVGLVVEVLKCRLERSLFRRLAFSALVGVMVGGEARPISRKLGIGGGLRMLSE